MKTRQWEREVMCEDKTMGEREVMCEDKTMGERSHV